MSTYDPLNADADPFGPPALSTIVHCLHCKQEYDSYRIEWRVEDDGEGRQHGFWCCPIENCDGRGFGFDIFPIDPDYRDENGEKMWMDDEEDEEYDEDEAGLEDKPASGDGSNGSNNSADYEDPKDDNPLPW